MVSAINTALSGFKAATTQLSVSASNTANQFSTQSNVNGKTVNKAYAPQKVDLVTLSSGGVQAKVSDTSAPTTGSSSSSQSSSQSPNVDSAQETVNQNIASYNAQADLKVIAAANSEEQSLLNITA